MLFENKTNSGPDYGDEVLHVVLDVVGLGLGVHSVGEVVACDVPLQPWAPCCRQV